MAESSLVDCEDLEAVKRSLIIFDPRILFFLIGLGSFVESTILYGKSRDTFIPLFGLMRSRKFCQLLPSN